MFLIKTQITNGLVARTIHCVQHGLAYALISSYVVDSYLMVREYYVVEHIRQLSFASFEGGSDLVDISRNIRQIV